METRRIEHHMSPSELATFDDAAGKSVPAVELHGVSKSYVRGSTSTRVVHDVSLTVKRGECIFLLGPSGSGKTTLLSIIGCVLAADFGSVRILGRSISDVAPDAAAQLRRRHIGFVFQRFHLIRGLTACENVAVPLTLSQWRPADATQRAVELLSRVGMSKHTNAQPQHLSVGQCQRVAFARALACNPDLILADEPTASPDAKTGHQALELLRDLTVAAGKTVIIVTHDPRILKFADRILHMENGTLEERTPSDDAMTDIMSIRDSLVVAH